MSNLLEAKRIVVTGASRGLGRAIALACAREGADIGVGYRTHAAEAEDLVREIRDQHGRDAIALGFDVADPEAVDTAVGRAWEELGRIDGWVNNAAENLPDLLVSADVERLRRQLETNLLGPMLCARSVIGRMMKQRSGVVLNVSSVAAARPARGQAAYAATKGGIEALTRALAVEYAKKGIRVVCLRPGPIDTQMLASTRVLAEDEVLARTPMKRIASATEVAEHAVFLLSDRASYATGSVVTVDGGYVVG